MSQSKIVALQNKYNKNKFLLPISGDRNLIMELQPDGTWYYKEGSLEWSVMVKATTLYTPLYEVVV